MVAPDIRRLQYLNDLITQTLEAIQARSIGYGIQTTPFGYGAYGSYGSPYLPQVNALGQLGIHPGATPWTAYNPYTIGGFPQALPFGANTGFFSPPVHGFPHVQGFAPFMGNGVTPWMQPQVDRVGVSPTAVS